MTIDQSTELEILPASRPIQAQAADQLMVHAQAMSHAKQLADALCDTDLVPAVYRGKPGNGAAAILFGSELGLNPIQSLQNIFVVHGQPAIYARTAVALVKRHGYEIRTVEESPKSVTVSGTNLATGHVEVSTWDMARAEAAGYTSNKRYQTNPAEMLYAKAAMEVCRRIAPDVLMGIAYSSEELEADRPQPEPARRVVSNRRGVDGLRAAITPPPAVVEAEPEPQHTEPAASGMAPATRKKWLNSMFAALGEADCTERDDQIIVIAHLAGRGEPLEHRDGITDDELRTVVGKLNEARKEGRLGAMVTDVLNEAALREAGHDAAE